MKIIYTIDTLETGGAEKSTLDIASRLSDDVEVVIVIFYEGDKLLQQHPEFNKINIIQAGLKRKYDFLKAISFFKKICKEEKPDLVVATLFRSEIISRIACKQLGIKNIGTFVNDTYSAFELNSLSFSQKLKINFFKILNKYTAKNCMGFLANAESIKISNAKALSVPVQKIKVIYRGRNTSSFIPNITARLSHNNIKFINVGRLLPRKGQAELIKAFALFLKEYPEATLDIAGEGKYREHLAELILTLGISNNVHLLGTVKDIPALLGTYDIFAFPSHYEGFSGALVEAMLAGLPVIASNIEMNKEAVKHLETGYLFEVKNEQSILRAMRFANSNRTEMKEMARNANEFARQHFDINIIANKHEQYYKECVIEK